MDNELIIMVGIDGEAMDVMGQRNYIQLAVEIVFVKKGSNFRIFEKL